MKYVLKSLVGILTIAVIIVLSLMGGRMLFWLSLLFLNFYS